MLKKYKDKLSLPDSSPSKQGSRLSNLSEGTEPLDAVNVSQLQNAVRAALSIEVTKAELNTLVTASTFVTGVIYKITDVAVPHPEYITFLNSTANYISSIDRYTSEHIAFKKVTTTSYDKATITDADIDNIIYIKIGSNYYERIFKELTPDNFGAVADYNSGNNTGTDSTLAFEACATACNRFKCNFRVPANFYGYLIARPIYMEQSVRLYGDTPGINGGSRIYAKDGFVGDGVILSAGYKADWATDRNWFWNSIEEIYINCRSVTQYGIGIYNMNETCNISRTVVVNAIEANYLMAGEHAPCTMRNINSNNGKYAVKFTTHPLHGTPKPGGGNYDIPGNGGVIDITGISGDNHTEDFIYINGSHRGHIYGIKTEISLAASANSHKSIVHFSGSASVSPVLTITGACNRASSDLATSTVVKISGGNRATVMLAGFNISNTVNIIADATRSITIPATGISSDKVISFNHSEAYFSQGMVLNQDQKLKYLSDGVLRDVIHMSTDLITKYRAARSAGGTLTSFNSLTCLKFKDTGAAGSPQIGFFGTEPIAKPAITGSRGGNAALTSLLTQLAALGLITDSTSA